MSGHPSAGSGAAPGQPVRWAEVAWVVCRAVAGRPVLWPATAATLWRLASPGWWRHWPPMPVPDPQYWRFRLETAYGGEGDGVPDVDDVVAYLSWCRGLRAGRG